MAIYKLDSGKLVDTKKAVASYEEHTEWNGNNHISINTGSQWAHEQLYMSKKGTWYLVFSSQWQGSLPEAREVPREDAAKWLLFNRYALPEGLEDLDIIE